MLIIKKVSSNKHKTI